MDCRTKNFLLRQPLCNYLSFEFMEVTENEKSKTNIGNAALRRCNDKYVAHRDGGGDACTV